MSTRLDYLKTALEALEEAVRSLDVVPGAGAHQERLVNLWIDLRAEVLRERQQTVRRPR